MIIIKKLPIRSISRISLVGLFLYSSASIILAKEVNKENNAQVMVEFNAKQLQNKLHSIESFNKIDDKTQFIQLIIAVKKNTPTLSQWLTTKDNRQLLTWLIEQSENKNITLAKKSIEAMRFFIDINQAKIQLGKLTITKRPEIAISALTALANSSLQGKEIITLFKKQLKNANPEIVMASITGLVKRQKRDEMSWALKILKQKDSRIKNHFAQLIYNKNKKNFANVLQLLTKDPDPLVSNYVKELIKE